ncbi:hypothetical protein ABU162_28465 [Paenibacillus thiaminolyticus]|uniref:hypothetical protein n=1 Tax=Paenibacillus thiaminolyticus TaxID=49283 RepID=UPI0035A5BEE3
MKRLESRFLMQSNSDRYDDEEKSGNYTRWVNGELYLDSAGNSGEHGQLADWSGPPSGYWKIAGG